LDGKFLIGQYHPDSSFGHRLDPRAKILMAVYLMLLSIFCSSPFFYLLIICGLTLLLLRSNISYRIILKNMRPFLLLILITALYHLIFSARDSATVLNIFGWHLTSGGLYLAATFSLRVFLFLEIAFFLTITTMPSDLAEALVGWLRPFKRFGIPADDILLIVFIAMRFVPVLAEEFDIIKKAQIVRGVDFSGGLIKKGRKMTLLLIPIFQSALRRADDLALAIESRGYVSGAERSSFRVFEYTPVDILFLLVSFSIGLILFWLIGF